MSESQDPQKPAVIPPAAKAAQARQAAGQRARPKLWMRPTRVGGRRSSSRSCSWGCCGSSSSTSRRASGPWLRSTTEPVVGFALLIAGFGMTMKWK